MWTALTLAAVAVGVAQQTTDDPPGRFGAFLDQRENPSWAQFDRIERERDYEKESREDYLRWRALSVIWKGNRIDPESLKLGGRAWELIKVSPLVGAAGATALEEWSTVSWWNSTMRGVQAVALGRSSISILMEDPVPSPTHRFHDPLAVPGAQTFGEFGFEVSEFGELRALAFDGEKHLWALDRINNRVVELELSFVAPGDLSESWIAPEAAFEPDTWETDGTSWDRTFVWAGRVVQSFGSRGQGPGQFSYPTDLDIHDGRVYVTDRGNHRIQVFDLEGEYLYEWGIHSVEPGDGEGKLHYPESLAISLDGTVAVVHEPLLGRLQAFGLTDEPAEKFMTDPVTLTGLGGHMGPRFSVHGSKVAIFDPEAQRVQLYDTEIASVPIKVTEFGGAGTGPGQFMDLVDLTFDERGDLWVLDRGTRSVAQLRANYDKDLRGFDARLMSMVRRFDLEALAGEREFWCDWPDRLGWESDGLWIGQGSSRWRLERPEGERRWVLGPDSPQGPRSVQPQLDRASWVWNQGSAELGPHDLRKPTAAQWVGDDLWVLDFGHHRLLRYDSAGAVTAAIGPPSYTRPARRSAPAPQPVNEEE